MNGAFNRAWEENNKGVRTLMLPAQFNRSSAVMLCRTCTPLSTHSSRFNIVAEAVQHIKTGGGEEEGGDDDE